MGEKKTHGWLGVIGKRGGQRWIAGDVIGDGEGIFPAIKIIRMEEI